MRILKILFRLAWLAVGAVLFLTLVTSCNQPGPGNHPANPITCAYNPECGPSPAPSPAATTSPGQPQFGTACTNPAQRIGNAICDPAAENGYPPDTWQPA